METAGGLSFRPGLNLGFVPVRRLWAMASFCTGSVKLGRNVKTNGKITYYGEARGGAGN
jgi:hypothetical protein